MFWKRTTQSWMKSNYHGISPPSSDPEREDDEKLREGLELDAASSPVFERRRRVFSVRSLALAGILCLGGGLGLGYLAGNRHHEGQMNHMNGHQHMAQEADGDYCAMAPSRREWSTFSLLEKSDYLRAVRAMIYSESVAGSNGTLFDDFPYVRAEYGRQTIGASSFLPWNRYFLHVYEKKLKEKGGYKGELPYWAWGKPGKSGLADHAVFTKTIGFGGDGKLTTDVSVGGGHLVVDGSFADLPYSIIDAPDGSGAVTSEDDVGLRRSFTPGDESGVKAVATVSPQVISDIIHQPNFESFLHKLEHGPMKTIPEWVNGHFTQLTGPNDPLFMLHLTSIDRLWWLWQVQDPFHRNEEYSGVAWQGDTAAASMDDIISVGGYLAPDVKLYDLMATNYGGILCYNYTIA